MKRHLLFSLALLVSLPYLQQTTKPPNLPYAGIPPNPCANTQLAINLSNGHQYNCPGATWNDLSAGSGTPSGLITFIVSGTCPSGWSQVTALDGVTVYGTLAAHGDVGNAAGNATITPTVSSTSLTAAAQAFTGSSGTVPAEAFTGSSTTVPAETVNSLTAAAQTFTGAADTTSSVSGGTPAGTNTLGAFSDGAISWPVGVPTNASGAFSEGAISYPVNVPTFSGSALGTHLHGAGTLADATSGTGVKLFTTSSLTASAATLSGSTAAISAGTPAGTVAWPANPPTIAAGTFTQPTISWPAGVPTIAAGIFTQPTFTGNALAGHTHTVTPTGTNGTSAVTGTLNSTTITPLGSNGTVAFTPAGTNGTSAVSGSITMNAVSPQFSGIKAIFCQKI